MKVEECTYFINKLVTVSYDAETDIQKAESLYNTLTIEEKAQVQNFATLQNAKAAHWAAVAINKIGVVILDSENAILDAENAYNSLTSGQKQAVANYATLTTARAVYNTMARIAEIGEVQITSEPQIISAEELYLALSDEQKDLVTNYSVLTSACKSVDTLLTNAVIEKITAIGSISLDSESKIAEAESAYSALNSAQKELIANYETLIITRTVYNVMPTVEKLGTVQLGSGTNYSYKTLSAENMENVLNNAAIRDEVDSITVSDLVEFENQGYWTSAFKNLNLIRYDITSGTSLPLFSFTPSRLTYRVVGSTSTYKIALKASSGDELNLEFESFNITNSGTVLDVTNVGQTNIKFLTTCELKGGNNNIPTINAKNLTLDLVENVTVNITASDGTSEVGGGIGINATNLIFNGKVNSYLTVKGGNGVDGVNG